MELTYEQVYESCKKELTQQLDLSTNKDHFVACFRNLSEETLRAIHDMISNTNNMEMVWNACINYVHIESESRITRIARQHALALLEDLS